VNWDLAEITTTDPGAVIELAEAAQRALAGRVIWKPDDAAAVVRAELLPLWPHVAPAEVRDVLCRATELALDAGVVGVPESLASWPTEAMVSVVGRTRRPDPPWPTSWRPLDVAVMIAFDQASDAEALQSLAVLLALAYAPGASAWLPWRCLV
jgi:hypothetical protein